VDVFESPLMSACDGDSATLMQNVRVRCTLTSLTYSNSATQRGRVRTPDAETATHKSDERPRRPAPSTQPPPRRRVSLTRIRGPHKYLLSMLLRNSGGVKLSGPVMPWPLNCSKVLAEVVVMNSTWASGQPDL